MIVDTEEFKSIAAFDYINRYLKEDKRGTVDADSPDEPVDSIIQRRVRGYYEEEPRVQIASYLGLIEPRMTRINDQPDILYRANPKRYRCLDEHWILTDKGNQLWSDAGQTQEGTRLPLAVKRFVAVTGITKVGETEAQVEFTWAWDANELGKDLDPNTPEFKLLPADMQNNLTNRIDYQVSPFIFDFTNDRKGRAQFRRYDDGWRLMSISMY